MSELTCPSKITKVLVYARGAEITRELELPASLPGGALELCVEGITALSDPGSFRAVLSGARQGVGLRTQLILPPTNAQRGPLSQQLRALRLTKHQLEAEQLSLAKHREQLSQLSLRPNAPRPLRAKASPSSMVTDLTQGNRFVQEKLAALDAQLSQLALRLEETAMELEVAMVEARQSSAEELHGELRPTRLAVLRIAGGGELRAVSLVYTIGAARWWPAYTARLSANATKATLSLEAFIAQASGEDWSDVSLSLCTADLVADARLPELSSLRLGRSQPKPKRGFREPPQGLDELFRSYEQALSPSPGLPAREESTKPKPRASTSTRTTTTESDDASELFSLALASRDKTVVPERAAELPTDMLYERAKKQKEPSAPLTLSGALDSEILPAMSRASGVGSLVGGFVGGIMGGVAAAFGAKSDEGGRGGGLARAQESAEAELPDGWLDFDSLTLSGASGNRRGKLTRIAEPGFVSNASYEVEQLSPPYLARDPRESRGQFAHRYTAQGQCEISSTGKAQRVHLLTAESPASPMLRAVPREASDVYREASVKNPFDAPLLSGPIEIFIDGALLTTTMSAVDRGGYLSLGLGVEERLRISRNARVEESSTGLLSGKTHIDHHISIEVASALGYPTRLEVIDRIPVSDDKVAEIVLGHVVPASQWYDQVERGRPLRGGILWELELPPAGKLKIEFSYRINLPAKNEVIGGNRREG